MPLPSLDEVAKRVAAARAELIRRQTQRDNLLARRQAALDRQRQLQERAQVLEQTIALLREAAEHARDQARQHVEGLVANCLRYVFGPDFGFRIEMKDVAGRPQAEFYVTSTLEGERLETRPEESRGGGVVDVVALSLRLAMLEAYRPRPDGPVILDEPAKMVSEEFIQAVAHFLKEVSACFGRQVIMVTHNAHLAEMADRAFRVQIQDGASHVTLVRGEGH